MLRETMTSTMPVAMIAMPHAWTAIVIMFAGLDQLAAAPDVEDEQDQAERDEHAEQAEVDLRLRDQTDGSRLAPAVAV